MSDYINIKTGENVYKIMTESDLSDLNLERNDKGEVFLNGSVSFRDRDYNWLLTRKVYYYDIQLEVKWNGFDGVMSLDGEWWYDQKRCRLKVGGNTIYDEFKTILNKDYVPTLQSVSFTFDSYLDTKYSDATIIDDVYPNYQDTGGMNPPAWDSATKYIAGGNIGGKWYGSDSSFVTYLGFPYVASTDTIAIGDNPATDSNWIKLNGLSGDDVREYKQERALFEFGNSIYSEINSFWYNANTSDDTYTATVVSYDVRESIRSILEDNSFVLNSDWLKYPASINADYDGSLYIINTKTIETIKLSELIEIIEKAFQCEYRLNSNRELYFIHKSEEVKEWKQTLNLQNDLSSIDIYEWKVNDYKSVKRHVLNFTESGLGTHDNSIIEYDNNFFDEAEVKPSFDVDFVYSVNEGGVDCLVTIDSTNFVQKIDGIYNPYLIPGDLHRNFYFVGREYTSGIFQENVVSLQQDYFEETERELTGDYDINAWQLDYLMKINVLSNKYLYYNEAKCDKIVYSIDSNKFTLSLKTKI